MTTEKRNANLFASQCLFQSETAELGSHFWLVRIKYVTLPHKTRIIRIMTALAQKIKVMPMASNMME